MTTKKNSPSISKVSLFHKFFELIRKIKPNLVPWSIQSLDPSQSYLSFTYSDIKMAATEYKRVWNILLENYFVGWICNDSSYEMFRLEKN